MKFFISISDYSYAFYLKVLSSIIRPKPTACIEGQPKQTIILIPGVYENWYYFQKLALALKSEGCLVLHSDIITMSNSVLNSAEQINTYIQKNKLQNVILIGHSSGGLTAVLCLEMNSSDIAKVITIATPFSGVYNGHVLRTKRVKELLPKSEIIKSIELIDKRNMAKITSLYPKYDNQVWHRLGSMLPGATNKEINAVGHHLILKNDNLINILVDLVV